MVTLIYKCTYNQCLVTRSCDLLTVIHSVRYSIVLCLAQTDAQDEQGTYFDPCIVTSANEYLEEVLWSSLRTAVTWMEVQIHGKRERVRDKVREGISNTHSFHCHVHWWLCTETNRNTRLNLPWPHSLPSPTHQKLDAKFYIWKWSLQYERSVALFMIHRSHLFLLHSNH